MISLKFNKTRVNKRYSKNLCIQKKDQESEQHQPFLQKQHVQREMPLNVYGNLLAAKLPIMCETKTDIFKKFKSLFNFSQEMIR